jgi:hypothetical protein
MGRPLGQAKPQDAGKPLARWKRVQCAIDVTRAIPRENLSSVRISGARIVAVKWRYLSDQWYDQIGRLA